MKRISTLCILAFLMFGCLGPQFQIPEGVACLIYADGKEMYGAAKVLIQQGCRIGKLDAETCKALQDSDLRLKVLDAMVRRSLANPQTPPDWEKIMEVAQLALAIGLKAAGVP